MLTIQRNRTVAPMARSSAPRAGDRAAIALYTRGQDQATADLATLGWTPVPARTDSLAAIVPG